MDALLLIPIALPVVGGAALLVSSFREGASVAGRQDSGTGGSGLTASRTAGGQEESRVGLCVYVGMVLGISVILALTLSWTGERELVLFTLLDTIPVYFRIDAVGRLFVTVVSLIWLMSALSAFVYMRHEGKEKRYFGFYLILYGILVASDFAGNLVTLYLFYELTTLASMPQMSSAPDITPTARITAVFNRFAHFSERIEETIPENMDIMIEKKGTFCIKSIKAPPS